jgi:sigma-B regulation protein RsbU (phosphoserine phosphatase)
MRVPLQPVTGMKAFLGVSYWRFQLVFLAVCLAFSGFYWLILGPVNLLQFLFFALVAGNSNTILLKVTSPLYVSRPFPRSWLLFLAVLIPVNVFGGTLASVGWRLVFGQGAQKLSYFDWSEIRIITFVGLVSGVAVHLSRMGRARLEQRNRELESQVTLGQLELKSHEAESKAAHEIQTHLLPREIPQLKGFEIACAWQPAQSVGGDYFDVLALGPGQIAVCLADVSGKGIAAALLMANLQATVRAFAPEITGPGALCRKVNEVLCGSVAPGKFVTMFYGVIDSQTLTLRFENAGHCPPVVLRGDSATELTEGSIVLGIFSHAEYAERRFRLQSADCLLLTTDGVTEAANEADEEFGAERVTASARAARSLGAHGIRTRILEDVSRFCNGNFHDDASLIVVTVD